MDIITITSLAVGLAMDCFAVAITVGVAVKDIKPGQVLKIAAFFGGFQTGMTLIGWALGTGFSKMINSYDHWIAFGLLLFVGGKMIKEAFEKKEGGKATDYSSTKVLLMLSVATSIDALAVGVSFSFLNTSVIAPAAAIGLASFIFPIIGVWAGKKTGEFLENKAEFFGGLVLIGIGIKILVEHLIK
jgi:putative Mn2+ efflux pump MntP